MNAIRELEQLDTRENELFRAIITPPVLGITKKYFNYLHRYGCACNPPLAKVAGKALERLDYEKFPSLLHIVYMVAMTPV